MNARVAAAAGGVVLAGAALYRFFRLRARRPADAPADLRADELRRKLAESRSLIGEQDEFEAAETAIDAVEPVEEDLQDRRQSVHERGRAALDDMRRAE